jgi:hypothetical protein
LIYTNQEKRREKLSRLLSPLIDRRHQQQGVNKQVPSSWCLTEAIKVGATRIWHCCLKPAITKDAIKSKESNQTTIKGIK